MCLLTVFDKEGLMTWTLSMFKNASKPSDPSLVSTLKISRTWNFTMTFNNRNMSSIMLVEEYQEFSVRNRTEKRKRKKEKSVFQIYDNPHVSVCINRYHFVEGWSRLCLKFQLPWFFCLLFIIIRLYKILDSIGKNLLVQPFLLSHLEVHGFGRKKIKVRVSCRSAPFNILCHCYDLSSVDKVVRDKRWCMLKNFYFSVYGLSNLTVD